MGKSQVKKKTHGRRHNPMRVPDAHLGSGKGVAPLDGSKEKQMLPILNKLRSPAYADRTWACAVICTVIQNDPATRRMLQGHNIVGLLIERLSDSVDEVVVEASGALRNMAIDGGYELCGEMYNKGIISHLTVLTGKIANTVDSIVSSEQPVKLSDEQLQARKHLLQLSENVISLIWSLAEGSHKTLQGVMGMGVEGLLIKMLEYRDLVGTGVTLASAQALYSLSQDNRPFKLALLRHPSALPLIATICQADHQTEQASKQSSGKGKEKANGSEEDADGLGDGRPLLARLLLCGVLRNVVDHGSPADASLDVSSLTNQTILPLVNGLLDVNLPNVVDRVSELVSQVPKAADVSKQPNGDSAKKDSPAEVALARIERMLLTVGTALEILTGICAGLEDVEESEPSEPAEGEDDEMDADDGMNDEDLIDAARDASFSIDQESAPAISTSITLPHLITKLSLPSRLASLAALTPLSFPPSTNQPSPHPPTTAALSMLHLRALETLNNLLLTTAAAAESEPSAAQLLNLQPLYNDLLSNVSTLCSEPDALKQRGQEMRLEVVEASLGCLWGVVKLSAESSLNVQNNEVQGLISAMPLLRESAQTRLVETLALVASRSNVPAEQNKIIASWLISTLVQGTLSPQLIIAVVNAVIDIYADEGREYDRPVFVAGEFLPALTGVVGKVRSTIKTIDKRKDRLLRVRGEEAYENLAAFVKYRRSLKL